jgi:hypothetical protein
MIYISNLNLSWILLIISQISGKLFAVVPLFKKSCITRIARCILLIYDIIQNYKRKNFLVQLSLTINRMSLQMRHGIQMRQLLLITTQSVNILMIFLLIQTTQFIYLINKLAKLSYGLKKIKHS